MRELLPYFALLISALACGISTWTAVRAGRWRNSEAHAALVGRVGELESWKGLTDAKIENIEHDLTQIPTQADFKRLEGAINTTNAIADRTEKAVQRLEDWWVRANK